MRPRPSLPRPSNVERRCLQCSEMEVEQVTREIPLPCGRVAAVSADKYERVSARKWHYDTAWRVVKCSIGNYPKRTTYYLHHEVLGTTGMRVRVKARDKNYLNCTDDNLYVAMTDAYNWTPELDAKLLSLRSEGLTHKQIGDQIGRDDSAVRRRLKKLRDKDKPATYRDKPQGRTWQELCLDPLVHVDVVTGEVLAWNLGGYRSTYV